MPTTVRYIKPNADLESPLKKRIEITSEKLEAIVQLRQVGTSWLGIQKTAGIPRRIAKREYLQWEQGQARQQLQDVRREVAAGEFKLHLDVLAESAHELRLMLGMRPGSTEMRKAAQVMDEGFIELRGRPRIDLNPLKLEGFNARQRRWMYEALRTHTRESVPWTALSDWTKSWDRSVAELGALRSALRSENLGEKSSEATAPDLTPTASLVWDRVWSQLSEGSLDPPAEDIFTRSLLQDQLADDASVAELASTCCREARRLLTRLEASNSLSALERLSSATDRLEAPLDELRLRPVLLRTRCELCPA